MTRAKRLTLKADRLAAERRRLGAFAVPAALVVHAYTLAALAHLKDAMRALDRMKAEKDKATS